MLIGFIGLGQMGAAMARNLLKAGHEVQVYNRSPAPAEELRRDGAIPKDSPRAAAAGAEMVVTMLADDAAVTDVVFGTAEKGGLLDGLARGAIHISSSTISPALAGRLSQAHAERGQRFVSAPVFGRPEAAAEAKLWTLAAGDEGDLSRCEPLFHAVSQGWFKVGDNPALANTFKLGGNFLIAAMLESLGEAFALVRKSGGDAWKFLAVVNAALFRSQLYENYGGLIAGGKFEPAGFKLDLGLKDIRLVLSAADRAEAPMPVASTVHDRMLSGVAQGLGGRDWSSVGALCAAAAGLPDA